MASNITTSLKSKEADLLAQKAKAKGVTKCAYVRDLIRSDLGNTQKNTLQFERLFQHE